MSNKSLSEKNKRPASKHQGQYSVIRGNIRIDGFDSFYEAYMYALNRFCSEDFLIKKKGW